MTREDWRTKRERSVGIRPRRTEDQCMDLVPFVPFACPRCGAKPRTYGVEGRIRYHHCAPCGYRYRSLECPPEDVAGFRGE